MKKDKTYYIIIFSGIFTGLIMVLLGIAFFPDSMQQSPLASSSASDLPQRTGVGALGKIEPRSRVLKVSHDAGPEGARIEKLLVTEGQTIKQGDKIAIFSDYARKQAKLQIARLQVAILQAHLEAEAVEEVFFGKEYHRVYTLAKSSVASEAKKDEAERDWMKSQATVSGLKAELKSAKANLILAEEELKQGLLLAPIAGTVLKIQAWPGERVSDDGVIEIADLTQMDVIAEIYERDMPFVKVGQKAEITVPGFDAPLTGEIRELGYQVLKNDLNDTDPLADRDNRVVEVRITLPEAQVNNLKHLIYMQVALRIL